MRPILAIALAASLVASVALTLVASAEAKHPAEPVRIGVIDLQKAFKSYRKSADLEKKINDERDVLKQELDQVVRQIAEATDPGDKEVLKKKFEVLKERLETKIKDRWEEYSLAIVDDINDAVRAYGTEEDFTLILRSEGKEGEGDNRLLQATLRSVLYAAPALDLTPEIVERLNRQYDLQAPPPAGGGAPKEGKKF